MEFKYSQTFEGLSSGFNVASVSNAGIVSGTNLESPITRKAGLQYQFDANDQVYVTAAKGFRPGGVNSPLNPALCTGLTTEGLTPKDLPTTYNSDSVWSYEAGEKARLLGNRVQLNGSVYRIDWTNVQTTIATTGCGMTYITNGGGARSQGFDLQAQARVFDGLRVDLAVGYDNAHYTTTTVGPQPVSGAAPTVVVLAGDKITGVAPWTVSLGGEYDFRLMDRWGAYIRADYRLTSKTQNTSEPGTPAYAPDAFYLPRAQLVNLRAGVTFKGTEFNIFVNNLFNSRDFLSLSGGRTGCSITGGAACASYTDYSPFYTVSTFRPREIGAQATYRY